MENPKILEADVVIIGSGPGGYTAAFRAADLGLKTVLVERYGTLGGVCLNVGCIPSKALLHTAEVLEDIESLNAHGIFETPIKANVNLNGLRSWKEGVVTRLTGGLKVLAKQRKIDVVQGTAKFLSATELDVAGESPLRIQFKNAIIAAGSSIARIPGFPDDPRMLDSTSALSLSDVPKRLLVIGGGIIGLEMATVYSSLGSDVTVVEMMDGLIPGCDPDLVKPLHARLKKRYKEILLSTRVKEIKAAPDALEVAFEGPKAPASAKYDKILVAVGRRPNGVLIGAEAAGVSVGSNGFIPVDAQQRTNVPNIFAIGDIVGQPMLAHKASAEGKVAAEVIAGHKSAFDAKVIPSVAYTSPEIAWVGLSEPAAREKGIDVGVGKFPFAASGRAMTIDKTDGLTKLVFDNATGRLIGAGITGNHAGEMISELALAIELGADAADIALTIHPHPSLSESVAMAAEVFEGTITDLFLPKKK